MVMIDWCHGTLAIQGNSPRRIAHGRSATTIVWPGGAMLAQESEVEDWNNAEMNLLGSGTIGTNVA